DDHQVATGRVVAEDKDTFTVRTRHGLVPIRKDDVKSNWHVDDDSSLTLFPPPPPPPPGVIEGAVGSVLNFVQLTVRWIVGIPIDFVFFGLLDNRDEVV